MAKIYESIMHLVKPARIGTAAAELNETEKKVSAASDIILPSLLARMLKKGDTPEVEEVLKESKRLKIYENYDKIWKGSGIDTHENMGERMENRLLGTHDPKFNSLVGTHTGMKKESADRLTNWVAGTMAAWFASHMAAGKSYKELLAELAGEKEVLRKDIPADIITELGLGHALGVAQTHHATAHTAANKPAPKKKSSLGWLWWLLGLIALALIVFFCWKACDRKPEIITEERETVVHNVATKFTTAEHILPDGTVATFYKGDLEEAIGAFVASDKFKNATDAELRTVWFEFSNIDFEHNSSVDLMPGAQAQLNTLVNVLKKHPGLKIKIGAFADKTGTRAVNYAISEQRARNIEAALEKGGIAAADVSTEGFGEQYASVPEGASNVQRAPDRDIAMRFTK